MMGDPRYDHDYWPARSNFGKGGFCTSWNFELDPNARHWLAVARTKLDDVEKVSGSLHVSISSAKAM